MNFSKNYKAWYFEQLVKKERMSNEANQELMTLPSGEVIETFDVWLGKKKKIEVVVKEDVYLTVPKRKKRTICIGNCLQSR